MSRVRLTGGLFAERQRIHTNHLLAIEPDRLLAPFRMQAGLPPRAECYGGWESRDIRGHSLGHYLSAIAHLHAATGNDEARSRAGHIVDELEACQKANGDGYVLPVAKEAFDRLRRGEIDASPFALNGVWVPFYTLHKVMAGLRDVFRLCGTDQALRVSRAIGDWLLDLFSNLDDQQVQALLVTEHGGMNEVLADLTEDTGDPRFLALAARGFHHAAVLDPMFRGEDRLNGLHGNTQIPKVVGLAREHELSGDPRYRTAAESFWNHVVHHRSYVTGGHGESEHFFPVEQFPLRLTPNTCETCNTYNMLKLTRHLFSWRPDAARMDFVERAMINHLAANIGRRPGEFGYFLGLGSVGVKVFSTPYDSWWCCVGTGLENPARYGEMIYASDGDSLWLNLFMESSLEWTELGVRVEQWTDFPEDDRVKIVIRCEAPVSFEMKIRHPGWCDVPAIRINGLPVSGSSATGYRSIRREWSDGDVVDLHLPMSVRSEALPHSDGSIIALTYGPSVLAGMVPLPAGQRNPATLRFEEHLAARGKIDAFPPCFVAGKADEVIAAMTPGDGFAEFRSQGVVMPEDLRFVPLHRIYEEPYAVYYPLVSPDDWSSRKREIETERDASRRLEEATCDFVTPGYQQPEVEHSLSCERSEIEDFDDRKCRVAKDGGWFSYQLKVDPGELMALVITYWGGVWHERNFDILLDGEPVASQKLLANRPGDFFEQYHEIPASRTAGRSLVTVRFQSRPGDIAGGVFGVRMMRASAVPAHRYEQTIVFKDH